MARAKAGRVKAGSSQTPRERRDLLKLRARARIRPNFPLPCYMRCLWSTRICEVYSPSGHEEGCDVVLTIRQIIYNVAFSRLRNHEFSRADLLRWIDSDYPGTNHDSILPSDYLRKDAVKRDPSNDGNRGNYWLYPRFLERRSRDRYIFIGWDGRDSGSIDVPVSYFRR